MKIHVATSEDCTAVAAVHVESWQHAYRGILSEQYLGSLSVTERADMWRRMVESHPSHLLVARTNSEVVGFVAFGSSHDTSAPQDRAEIYAIYVRSAFWSVGAGRMLWLEAKQRIVAEGYQSISLWVIAANRRAIEFYERAGFSAEPDSRKLFELGGTTLEELRYVRNSG